MATTSIWPVRGWLGRVVIYVEDPAKTENPDFYTRADMTDVDAQGLSDVIAYAMQSRKTAAEDGDLQLRRYISSINCDAGMAREQMLETKRVFEKSGGIVGYHGYQSFAEGEVTPELAHSIGVELATRLWGEDYQVVVTTHLDKKHHLHNHFIINSISLTGQRMWSKKSVYYRMREESDRLCREHGLSVIDNPTPGKSKQYAEWWADKNGKPTWRGLIKGDVDKAIRQSMTDTQFFYNLRNRGYEIKMGKDISVRPPGKERFLRLARNFGDDYTLESIRQRILHQTKPERRRMEPIPQRKQSSRKFMRIKRRKISGLMGLYLHYMFLLGKLPKNRIPRRRNYDFIYREDLIKIRRFSEETRMLCKNRIATIEQLALYKASLSGEIKECEGARAVLRRRLSLKSNGQDHPAIRTEIAALSARMKELRKDITLCDGVAERSGVIKEKLKVIAQTEIQRKEAERDVQWR